MQYCTILSDEEELNSLSFIPLLKSIQTGRVVASLHSEANQQIEACGLTVEAQRATRSIKV